MARELVFTLFCGAALAQQFEVAAVKPTARGAPSIGTNGGPGSRDPELFTGKGVPAEVCGTPLTEPRASAPSGARARAPGNTGYGFP